MSTPPPQQVDVIAGIAAVVFPGLGQAIRGQRLRGFWAAVGVLGLFLGGLLYGGIDTVDSKEDRVWFAGQALVGPITFAVDWAHQTHFKAYGQDVRSRQTRIILRSGIANETRTYNDAASRWEWTPLTQAELDAGMGPPNTKSIGKINEIAMLSATLAGMLNFIIILDALLPTSSRRRGNRPHIIAAPKADAGGGA